MVAAARVEEAVSRAAVSMIAAVPATAGLAAAAWMTRSRSEL
jgi:hypothetical protein